MLYTGRHFWNRKCRKNGGGLVGICRVLPNARSHDSVTGHVCVNSNEAADEEDNEEVKS